MKWDVICCVSDLPTSCDAIPFQTFTSFSDLPEIPILSHGYAPSTIFTYFTQWMKRLKDIGKELHNETGKMYLFDVGIGYTNMANDLVSQVIYTNATQLIRLIIELVNAGVPFNVASQYIRSFFYQNVFCYMQSLEYPVLSPDGQCGVPKFDRTPYSLFGRSDIVVRCKYSEMWDIGFPRYYGNSISYDAEMFKFSLPLIIRNCWKYGLEITPSGHYEISGAIVNPALVSSFIENCGRRTIYPARIEIPFSSAHAWGPRDANVNIYTNIMLTLISMGMMSGEHVYGIPMVDHPIVSKQLWDVLPHFISLDIEEQNRTIQSLTKSLISEIKGNSHILLKNRKAGNS